LQRLRALVHIIVVQAEEYKSACILRSQSRYNVRVRFRIRKFDKADFDTLWRIDQSCFDPQLAYSRPELAFYLRRPYSFTLVAESEVADVDNRSVPHSAIRESIAHGNGETFAAISNAGVLGFIVAESRRNNGHIITIDVIAEARRAGIGSALLGAAEAQLLCAGVAAVLLETPVNNAAAIRFYKKHGYFVEKTVAGYYSNQMDALVMTKELPKASRTTVLIERR
jgi:[ribosomal protein S18]-alanine N-acetyltransferase